MANITPVSNSDTQDSSSTIVSALLQILTRMNAPYTADDFTTLNEKFNLPYSKPPLVGYPTTKYMVIGRGAGSNVIGLDGILDTLKHNPTDSALFEHIPFIITPVTADLSAVERSKYRLRKLITVNGVNYFAYYAKVISFSDVVPQKWIVTIKDGVVVSQTPYSTNAGNLTPSPVDISNTVLNTAIGQHIEVLATATINLDATDIANIIDACNVIYKDPRYSTINEIGIVSGYDRDVTSTEGGVNATYTDLQCAQIQDFIRTEIPLRFLREYITIKYAITNSKPLAPVNI
jgi:hypothetical protein